MVAYYNELDPYAAQTLRNLIDAGHIAPGIVDERSIEDVRPSDLHGFSQWHFFAGIGVWSYALRRAGWADDRRVATASCPCQPFSAAGKGAGFDDERHLWPAFYHLAEQCGFPVILGEQVASKDADPWIDLVQTDMEALDYAVGAVPFPSASVGAPHIRDRLYWVAYSQVSGRGEERAYVGRRAPRDRAQGLSTGSVHGVSPGRVADADGWHASAERQQRRGEQRQQPEDGGCGRVALGGLADAILQQRPGRESRVGTLDDQVGRIEDSAAPAGLRSHLHAGPINGFWRDADWLLCRDGKWRPVEPGTFPLAHGAPARVGRLRAYGNAINAQAAQAFIESVMECLPE